MAKRAGLLRNRLNEGTLLSWGQTNESLPAADSSSPVIAVMQPAHAPLANHCALFQRACPASRRLLVQPQLREQALGRTFLNGASYTSNIGNQIYHSGQFILSHRYQGGLFFQVGYTFSRNIDDVSGGINTAEFTPSAGRGGAG